MLPSSDNFHQKYVKWNFKNSASTVFLFYKVPGISILIWREGLKRLKCLAGTKLKRERRGGEGEKHKTEANFRGRPFPPLPNLLSLFLPFLSPFDACLATTVNAWSISNSPLFIKRKKLFVLKLPGRLYTVKVIVQGSSPQWKPIQQTSYDQQRCVY